MFTDADPKPKSKRPPIDDDIHQFNELLDLIDHPVVEVHNPCDLAAPDPETVDIATTHTWSSSSQSEGSRYLATCMLQKEYHTFDHRKRTLSIIIFVHE